MTDFKKRKELKENLETAKKEFWQIVDPNDNGDIHGTPFIDELQGLCRLSDALAVADRRLEVYEENGEQDAKERQELEDEELSAEVDYYTAFVAFAKKYSSESSRVHSAMGAVKSEKKASASRENGKKGGRPRKSTNITSEAQKDA